MATILKGTNPAIAGKILRNFSIAFVAATGSVFAGYAVFGIATRKQLQERGSPQLRVYNAKVHPEQDRLDTIFDRTQLMNAAKAKKPWNRTAAEMERAKW